MPTPRYDTSLTVLLRYVALILFTWAIWVSWGWGVAISALIVLFGTGVSGLQRFVFVPVRGSVRVLFEGLFLVFGVFAAYRAFGTGWGTAILVFCVFLLFIAMKRVRYLLKQ